MERLRYWKIEHSKKVAALFATPRYKSERDLLVEIDRLLEENKTNFDTYGPFSELAVSGTGGDSQKVWRRRCLDTILPNNERIVRLMEKHKNSFGYPWDIYRGFLDFQVHATSFKENCLFEEKINDYKTFPKSFPNLIKRALGIPLGVEHIHTHEEVEYRAAEVKALIEKFLSNHSAISSMEPISRGVFVLDKKNGSRLRVFVTNTYFFTEHTYNKVLSEDPNISAIVCSNPYGGYTIAAKERCLADNIGLFTLREFMGAINFDGDRFLDFLSSEDRRARVAMLQKEFKSLAFLNGCEVYVYGSFLRRSVFADIDLLLVHPDILRVPDIDSLIRQVRDAFPNYGDMLHIETCSKREFPQLKLDFDNRIRVY